MQYLAPKTPGDVRFQHLQVRGTAPSSARPYIPYKDLIYRGEGYIDDAKRETAWKRYLENKTKTASSEGLVVQEIVDFEPLSDSRFWSQDLEAWLVPLGKRYPSVVVQSIQKGLEETSQHWD